jgi:hypothetical protein
MYLLTPERNYELKMGGWKVSGKESMCKGVSKMWPGVRISLAAGI